MAVQPVGEAEGLSFGVACQRPCRIELGKRAGQAFQVPLPDPGRERHCLEQRTVVACHCDACPLFPIRFDHLVLAVGGVTHFFGLPGVAENALTMKSLADASALHAHVIDKFDALRQQKG